MRISGGILLSIRNWVSICAVAALALSVQDAMSQEAVRKLPDFELNTPAGSVISSSQLAGKAVLINFWATWCAPCIQEIPIIEKAAKKHGPEGLAVVGVNYRQNLERVERFLKKKPVSYPVAMDKDGAFSRIFQVNALPVSIMAGRDGTILHKKVGAVSEEELELWITEALAR